MADSPLVAVERVGETAVVRFDRPPVNAFNLPLVEQFQSALETLAGDVPSGGVVLTGQGPTFSAGADFKEVPRYTRDEAAQMISHINAGVTLLYGLPTATVAAINGHAIGGAFVMMLACDVRLATSADAKLGLTEVTAGVPFPACPIEVVSAEIEPTLRRDLVLSGRLIAPDAAHGYGLVDALVGGASLLDEAIAVARERAAAASYAVVKEQLRRRTLSRMREIVEQRTDPLLEQWV